MTINQDIIQPQLGALVDLYQLDATALGSSVFYFTAATDNGANVSFGGQVYIPMPIEATGFQASSDGSLPRPKLQLSNVNKFLQPYLLSFRYFQGAKVTRIRTFDKYLDGHPSADSTQRLPDQIWYIDQMETMTKQTVVFSLVSPLDRPSVKLPARQILRDNGFPGAGFPYLT
jgi:lambda family phage minor tail protein L